MPDAAVHQLLRDDPRFVAAHRALRGDGDIQFDLRAVGPPEKAPDWLRTLGVWVEKLLAPVGRALKWITGLMPAAPIAQIVLWALIAAAVIAILWVLIDRVRYGRWRLPRWRRKSPADRTVEPEDAWIADRAAIRDWLREADALAAQGAYAEAIHHLLRRSVDDLATRRPALVRPASTGRDLAGNPRIPAPIRRPFGRIAALVERSLFARRPVDADDWSQARSAYTEFADAGGAPL